MNDWAFVFDEFDDTFAPHLSVDFVRDSTAHPILSLTRATRARYARHVHVRGLARFEADLGSGCTFVYSLVPWPDAPCTELPFKWRLSVRHSDTTEKIINMVKPCESLWRWTFAAPVNTSRLTTVVRDIAATLHFEPTRVLHIVDLEHCLQRVLGEQVKAGHFRSMAIDPLEAALRRLRVSKCRRLVKAQWHRFAVQHRYAADHGHATDGPSTILFAQELGLGRDRDRYISSSISSKSSSSSAESPADAAGTDATANSES